MARAAIGQIERDRSQRPALVGATLFAEDHAADGAEATHSRTRPTAAAQVQRCAAEALGPMRRSLLEHFQLADVTHLHHVADPHPDGAYGPYVRQARRASTQPLGGQILEGHYVHTPSVPLQNDMPLLDGSEDAAQFVDDSEREEGQVLPWELTAEASASAAGAAGAASAAAAGSGAAGSSATVAIDADELRALGDLAAELAALLQEQNRHTAHSRSVKEVPAT